MTRPAIYVTLYALILAVAAFLVGARHELDFRFFEWLQESAPATWREDVVVIDVPYGDAVGERAASSAQDGTMSQLLAFRARLTAFLNHLATRPDRPRAVLLDAWISEETQGLEELRASIGRLVAAEMPVFGAIRLANRQDPLAEHDRMTYRLLSGIGHTEFLEAGDHTILYMCRIKTSDGAAIAALQVALTEALYQISPTVCDADRHILVRVGTPEAYPSHAFRFTLQQDRAVFRRATSAQDEGDLSFDGKVLIVGSPHQDRIRAEGQGRLSVRHEGRPGPEMVAWAVMERFSVAEQKVRSVEALWNPWLLLNTTLLFSSLGCLAYVGIHRILPPTRRKLLWVAACACLATLAAFWLSIALLKSLGHYYVQVTLVITGIIVAISFTWRHFWWKRFLEGIEAQIRSEATSTPVLWDVFVSYSRELQNESWVRNEIYEPLKRATAAGRPLKVFLDKQSLSPGSSWYQELAKAVLGSRYFLPIYSKDYFQKDYCRLEMDWACLIREQRADFIFPIAKDNVDLPSPYQHIHYTSVDETKDFLARIVERVASRVSSQE